MFRVLDLFSGIGGFSLGLERTGGFETVAFCEIDPFCRKVLAKHWPTVRQYEDVRTLTADTLARDGIGVDVITGGFPCQDISVAGKQAGISDGTRSGLWSEIARLVGELRPQFVIVENVAALLGGGLYRVLGDLAEIGFDAEWHCIPASYVGAAHRRDRIWIVAHPYGQIMEGRTISTGIEGQRAERTQQPGAMAETLVRVSSPAGSTGGIAYDVPRRMDRLKSLGNAVVPQIPELIGRAILADSK